MEMILVSLQASLITVSYIPSFDLHMDESTKFFSRKLLVGAIILFLFTSSCNFPAQTSPPVGTILPSGDITSSPLPSPTLSLQPPTALIPVTGNEVVTMQCQFCVNDETHALLIMPERASFLVSEPTIGINCLTAKVENEQRIILCRGARQTTFTLNVCLDDAHCLQMPVTLMNCPFKKGVGGPKPTSLPFTPNAPTQVSAPSPTPINTLAATQVNTQSPLLATATTTASHSQPTKAIRITPLVTPPPSGTLANLQDPGEFVRWYFDQVWQVRNYQNLWDNYLTQTFKTYVSSGNFEEYTVWWNSVDRVAVNSVNVIQNSGTKAWVRVNVTFTMKDGRVISNQEYDYALLYDAARQTWMFNYNP